MSRPTLAVLSDIHGNAHALRAALAHIQAHGVDGIVFLGDYVTDFPGGPEVLRLLHDCRKRLPCWLVRGNREEYLLAHRKPGAPEWQEGSTQGSLLHAYRQLTDEDLDFFSALPVCQEIQPPRGEPLTICHASPGNCTEGLFFRPEAAAGYLERLSTRTLLCGHCHLARTICRMDRRAHLIGSVGLPEGFPGCAQFAYLTYEDGFWIARAQAVPYDVDAALAEFQPSGLMQASPLWCRAVMQSARTGANLCVALVCRAAERARVEGVPVAAAHYEHAAQDLGLPL